MKALTRILWKIRLGLQRVQQRQTRPISQFDPKMAKQILVVSCTAIGDTLLSTPALRATRRLFPQARIDWLVRDRYAELFTNNPDADDIIPYKGAYRGVFSLANRLRKRSYDMCLVFHDSDPCPIQAAVLAKIPFIMRSGLKDVTVAKYLSARVPYRDDAHLIEQRLDLLRHLTKVPFDDLLDTRMVLPVIQESVTEYWDKLGRQYDLNSQKEALIGFQVSAARAYRAWPKGHFAALGEKILESFPESRILIFGGPADARLGKDIKEKIERKERVLNLAGKLKITELPLALKGLRLLVTNDTGPFHVAVAVRTPTISLFVPSTVRHTGPYQDMERHVVIQKPRPCSPCLQKYCKEPHCMNTIEVEEVFSQVQIQLSKQAQDRPESMLTENND